MTITIDIPAISELAAAIRYHADHPRYSVGVDFAKPGTESISPEPLPPSGVNPDRVVTHEEQPAKRTRRTKAEMDAERKAIEETKGRRMDGTPQPGMPPPTIPAELEQAAEQQFGAPFQWTLELLKDTFLAITPEDDSQEAKDAANAKLTALKAIREAIAPEAQNLSTMDEKHYAEFAKQATAWYREQGLELKLPEGCDL